MRFSSRLIERYIVSATLPYFTLALFLLTTMLLAQQADRFAEVLGEARAPLSLAVQIVLGLAPNVLVFTLPMAMLVGTATGFSRMGGDSELVVMRASGVGTWRIVTPVLLMSVVLTMATLYVGLEMVPEAARMLRQTALRATLYKLESPVEPRSFNTEMPNKVVYVRDGDEVHGQWGRVFISWQEADESVRLITARSGRIDTSGEKSELVLNDTVAITLPPRAEPNSSKRGQVVTERSTQLRVRFPTERSALIKRLSEQELTLEEMHWQELVTRANSTKGAEQRAATTTLHKRLALCMAPLAFGLLGTGLGIRTKRGGRSLGVLLSLTAMVFYYLTLLAGEQLGRAGIIAPQIGPWLATILAAAASLGLLMSGNHRSFQFPQLALRTISPRRTEGTKQSGGRTRWPILTGLLDRSVLRSLWLNFAMSFTAMVAIFLIFTLFELLRFMTIHKVGIGLVARYLFFLLPFAGTALAPMSVLVTILVTYALISRRNEAVAWWACGQSVYRLALPGALFAITVGGGIWIVQEKLMPITNKRQETLRAQIRGGIARATTSVGRQWLATADANRLYSYLVNEEKRSLVLPIIYEFDTEGVHLRRVIRGQKGTFSENGTLEIGGAEIVEVTASRAGDMHSVAEENLTGAGSFQLFKPSLKKPSEQAAGELSAYIKMLKRREEGKAIAPLIVALERKHADPFAPLVMAAVGTPLALAFGRRSTMVAVCSAIIVGLAFWATNAGFQQMGIYGLLPPSIAVWTPLTTFAAIGIYLLSRTRT